MKRTPTETLILALRDGPITPNILHMAADRLEELSAWRPMESAPKDGTPIIAKVSNDVVNLGMRGELIAVYWWELLGQWRQPNIGGGFSDGYFVAWLPISLPPPPQTGES